MPVDFQPISGASSGIDFQPLGGGVQNLKGTASPQWQKEQAEREAVGTGIVDRAIRAIYPYFRTPPREVVKELAALPGQAIRAMFPAPLPESFVPNVFKADPGMGGPLPERRYSAMLDSGDPKSLPFTVAPGIFMGAIPEVSSTAPINTPIARPPTAGEKTVDEALKVIGAPLATVNELMSGIASPEAAQFLNPYLRALATAGMVANLPEATQQRWQGVQGVGDVAKATLGTTADVAVPIALGAEPVRAFMPGAPRPSGVQYTGLRTTQLEDMLRQAELGKEMRRPLREPTPMAPRTGMQDVPIVGRRPIDFQPGLVGQFEAKPGQFLPGPEVAPGPMARPGGGPPEGGAVSFVGQGVPSAMQAREMVQPPLSYPPSPLREPVPPIPVEQIQDLIQRRQVERPGQLESAEQKAMYGRALYSGAAIKPEDLRPAIEFGGRLLIGQRGDTHADVLERNGINPDLIPHEDKRRGFVNVQQPDRLLNRQEAQTMSGIPGTAKAGGLDSMDLPDAAQHAAMRQAGYTEKEAQDAIRELRTSDVSKETPSRNLPQVGQEIRPGTEAQGLQGKETLPTARLTYDPGLIKKGRVKEAVNVPLEKLNDYELVNALGVRVTGRKFPAGAKRFDQLKDDYLLDLYRNSREVANRLLRQNHPDTGGALADTGVFANVSHVYPELRDRLEGELAKRGLAERARQEAESVGTATRLYSGPALEDIKDIFTPSARLLLRSPERLKFKTEGQVDGGQLVNRLLNTVPTSEKTLLEGAGIKDAFPPGKKATAKEVDEWVKGNMPRVEVRKFSSKVEGQERENRMSDIIHELDTKWPEWDRTLNESNGHLEGLPIEANDLYGELISLRANEGRPERGERAHWSSIAPKPESEMPGYVEGAVVVPRGTEPAEVQRRGYETGDLFPSSHSFPPNTLGFFRGYMEGDTFHVIEVQSDWAKRVREEAEERAKNQKQITTLEERARNYEGLPETQQIADDARATAESLRNLTTKEHPLLRDWERLTVKAAIDHAIKSGAKRIAFQDAESAMMMEGHDRARYQQWQNPQTGQLAEASVGAGDTGGLAREGWVKVGEPQIGQEKGMRLHYGGETMVIGKSGEILKSGFATGEEAQRWGERNIPKNSSDYPFTVSGGKLQDVAEELTGSKGEKVEFGEHKMAFDRLGRPRPGEEQPGYDEPRKNLIFKDPSGAPKTTITARAFPLKSEDVAPYSLTARKLYSGVPLFEGEGLKKVIDTFKGMARGYYGQERASQLLDAADTKARIAGQQKGNRISQLVKHDDIDDRAVTFINQAGGNVATLERFARQVEGKNSQASEAIQRAITDLPRLKPIADEASRILEIQRLGERAMGIETEHLNNYMKHAWETRKIGLFDTSPGGAVVSTAFLKEKVYPDYATGIADGAKPRDLRASRLIDSRVNAGQKLMNRYGWVEQLKEIKAPDGQPFLVDMPKKGKKLPDGYTIKELAPGVKALIHNDYLPIINALTGESFVRNRLLGQVALGIESGIKHGLLLFDSWHAFRMSRRELFLTGKVTYNKGASLLEYDPITVQRMVKEGELEPEVGKWIEANRKKAELLAKNGLNVGRISEALYTNVMRKELKVLGVDINLPGRFNKWVFEKLTRGAMLESGLIELERTAKQHPEWSEEKVASHVAKQLNVIYGNLQRQGIFKSASARDLLQASFLAPQWVESIAQMEARAAKQLVQLPVDAITKRRLVMGTAGKTVATGVIAYVVANQLINMVTRGHPTWENKEEGRKFDAFIPDFTGKSDGFWMSPLNDVAELTHDYIRYGHAGKSFLSSTAQILQNKESPLLRSASVALSGRDYSGAKLTDEERIKESYKALLPTPLPASGLLSEIPSQTARQAYSTFGAKVEPLTRQERMTPLIEGKDIGARLDAQKALKAKEQPLTERQRLRVVERAEELQMIRGVEMKKSLSKPDRQWLDSRGLILPGFDNRIQIGRDRVYLTKEEITRYTGYIREEYTKALQVARKEYDALDSEDKPHFFSGIMSDAKAQARERLINEIQSASETESNKKKFRMLR